MNIRESVPNLRSLGLEADRNIIRVSPRGLLLLRRALAPAVALHYSLRAKDVDIAQQCS